MANGKRLKVVVRFKSRRIIATEYDLAPFSTKLAGYYVVGVYLATPLQASLGSILVAGTAAIVLV